MEGKNIPPLITLTAAMIACVFCLFHHATLFSTLKIVLLVMILFYIIGRIVQKIVVKINRDAEEAAEQRQRESRELAARELAAEELAGAKAESPEGQEEIQEAGDAAPEEAAERQ